ncbi:hypothetical protein [Dactylosporangium sp. NPDC000521]|uniref:protein kinase domain-containing protein n=1 Tax=Dactylosporangium sp. NPDC000521 TaxID=3363975 RepID=UPI0036CAF264
MTRLQPGPRIGRDTATTTGAGQFVPQELLDRYVIGHQLGSGGEATVWYAHAVDNLAVPVALKVYRPGDPFDDGLRRRLDNPALHRYLPRLFGYGVAHTADGIGVGWEAMEYFPQGSLTDLVRREAPDGLRLPEPRLRAVLAELVDALDFWETIVKRRQTDLSPGNVLVRSDGPQPQLVLGDLGGVRSTGASERFGDFMAKAAYMSPEALAGLNDPRGPYWSLGVICFQLLTGHLVYGSDLTEDTMRVALVLDEPDVAELPDAWQDLVAGLLTRRPDDRWGGAEVRGWLAGRKIPVRRRTTSVVSAPITFASTPFRDPQALAAAMLDASEEAAEWLSGAGAARLRDWLADDVADNRFDRGLLADIAGDRAGNRIAAHVAVVAFAATYLAEYPPRYRGQPVTVDRLRALAGDPARHQLLVEIVRHGVLPYAARHRCEHPGCSAGASAGNDRCQVLAELGRRLPRAVTIAANSLASLPAEFGDNDAEQAARLGPAGRVLTDAVERDLCADAILLATGVEAVVQRRRRLFITRGPAEPWWRLRRRAAMRADPAAADGLAAVIVAGALRPFARDYQRALSAARRAARRDPSAGFAVPSSVGRVLSRLDGRAGQHTAPWLVVVLLAVVEALSVRPMLSSWPGDMPQLSDLIWTGVYRLQPHVPAAVTGAADPLAAWIADLVPEAARWAGLLGVAAVVLVCLNLARKTTGTGTGPRLVRIGAAVTGRLVMVAYVLHLAVGTLVPVAAGLTATSPLLVAVIIGAAVILFRAFAGQSSTRYQPQPAPWPARLLVSGGLLALTVLMLQHAPMPGTAVPTGAPPARSTTSQGGAP